MVNQRARKLRRNATEAEKRLWARIRNRQISGAKFRRQTPIGRYIVDFACKEHRLIVEIDGGQHATAQTRDQRRTRVLEGHGYRVIRFWNHELLENLDGVLISIESELRG